MDVMPGQGTEIPHAVCGQKIGKKKKKFFFLLVDFLLASLCKFSIYKALTSYSCFSLTLQLSTIWVFLFYLIFFFFDFLK